MLSFEQAKKALELVRENTKYFTRLFYNTYVQDCNTCPDDCINGKEIFAATKKTDFYIKNSGAYCQFLEIMYASRPLYRIEWYGGDWGATYLGKEESRFDTEADAKRYAKSMRKEYSNRPEDIQVRVEKIDNGVKYCEVGC